MRARAPQGSLARLRHRLFATPLDAAITLGCVAVLWLAAWPLLKWALLDATVHGASRSDCNPGGACWVLIRARFDQYMYGFYPASERWRVNAWALMLALGVAMAASRSMPLHRYAMGALIFVFPLIGVWLLYGGLGLPVVETRAWGGLMLTVFMSVYGGLLAVPLGILLALGRQSELPVIRTLSVIFIEFWRGVPIIAVIFLASLLIPLIMPSGIGVDRLARAVIGLGFVIAAYMAEAVRGGLQAVPQGQKEAASALGLGYWATMRLIVLPQALRISLPAMTNEFISLVKNTTLVLVVSIFDLLGIAQAAITDPNWAGLNKESYIFAGALYWLACFSLSRWSRSLERGQEGRALKTSQA